MTKPQLKLSIYSPEDIDSKQKSAWIDLEARAVEANAFLSPLFVLPAIKYLEDKNNIFVAFVEKIGAGTSELIGIGVFRERAAIRQFPLKHIVGYQSTHSYLSGLLIDKDHVEEVLGCIYEFVDTNKNRWHGLIYEMKVSDETLDNAEHVVAAGMGFNWTEFNRTQRAILKLSECGKSSNAKIPKNTRKNFERRMRRLKELGNNDWQLVKGDSIKRRVIDNFIRLEDMGWKGQEGTSLISNPDHVLFFEEMIKGFRDNERAFFTELSIDNKVISSTSNLVSGTSGFAFKIGWNKKYANLSPGVLNEIVLMQRCKELLGDLDLIDSCAAEDSYINKLWPWKREIVSGIYTTTTLGSMIAKNMKRIKEHIKKLKEK